jgi:WD40 repeat protein
MTALAQISILFLGSGPTDEQHLELTREFEDIRNELRARCPGRFEIEAQWHTKATDLPRLVMDHQPHVLHFSGHGQSNGELVFEDEHGYAMPTDSRAVARVFELLGSTLRCVVLNACYSESQAKLIAEHVDVVIGMSRAIRDSDARQFAKGFYEALSFGKSAGEAFELAKVGVWLGGSDGQEIPQLHARPGVDPRQVFVGERGKLPAEQAPTYVFVAHASADKLLVTRLCRGLLARGVRPWLDIWDLAPGHDWEARLRDTLTKAPAVLVCEGPHGSGLQQREYGKVLRDRIQAPGGLVFWVRLPGAPSTSGSEREGLDVIELDEANWSAGVERLAARIGIDRARSHWRSLEAEWTGVSETELSPYRGLSPFRERDARWMFGRDEEVASLLALAGKQALLTVIGASGSGKSSLVMAGLCAALRNGALDGERISAIGYLRPGKTPCEELARALVSLSPVEDPATRAMTIAKLRDHLQDPKSADMLKLVVRETVPNLDDRPTRKLLLVVDQLEELFTEARLGQDGESPEVMPFVRNIIEATKGDDAPLWIVTTLRADFLPHCLAIAELARTLNSGTYFALPPMREEQVREAVELPALRVGFEVEPKLVEKLVTGAAEQAGRLPLLQHVLRELWERRDDRARSLPFSVYADTGGLEGAIAKAAERALSSLREQLGERAVAVTRRVMTRLVNIGEGTQSDTRRRVSLDEIGRDDETRRVLDVFVGDARVLVSDEAGGVEVIEIAHEALLREWRTLVSWLDADRGALRLRQELARDAAKHAAARDSEYLWRRGRIDESRRVLRATSVDLNEKERAFLETSHRAERARSIRVWAAVAATFVVLLGLVAFAFNLAAENKLQAQQNARRAQENAELAESEREQRRVSDERLASQKGLRASILSASGGSYIEAAVLAIEAVGTFGYDSSRLPIPDTFEGLLGVLAAEPAFEFATLEGHSDPLVTVAFSPDGFRIATGSDDGTARIWEVASGKLVAKLEGHSGGVKAVVFSRDGSNLATASNDKTARLWDASGKHLYTLEGHSEVVNAVTFSPDNSRLATASNDKTARLWDVTSGKFLATLEGHSDPVEAVAFSPDGSRLATASRDNTARVWDVASGKFLATLEVYSSFEGRSPFVNAVAFSPDGSRLATAGSETAQLWDVESGKVLATLEGHSKFEFVYAVAFSPDGSRLATATHDNTARLWDVESGESLASLEGHSSWVVAVAFSPDGSRLATASLDNTARLWDVESGKLLATLEGHSDSINAMAFSPDGSRFATASGDKTARLWDVESNKPTLEGHSDPVKAVAFSPDGSRLVAVIEYGEMDVNARLWEVESGKSLAPLKFKFGNAVGVSPDGSRVAIATYDNTAQLWDVASGELLATLEGHSDDVTAVAFSLDGSRVATASNDKTARLWDAFGKSLATLEGHASEVNAIAISPDASRLATASFDNTTRLWEVESGKPLATLEGHSDVVYAVAFSPDGSRLATASSDHTARLWEVESGKSLAALEGHFGRVAAVAFSPDGSRLATASDDKTARLWEAASGKFLASLERHSDIVTAVAFSPDGSRLATASADGTLILWPMPHLALELVCRRIQHATRYSEISSICDPLIVDPLIVN